MATASLEERVTKLEAQVRKLEEGHGLDKSDDTIPWWKKIVGVYQDCPEFDEVVRLGQEWRRQEPPETEEGA